MAERKTTKRAATTRAGKPAPNKPGPKPAPKKPAAPKVATKAPAAPKRPRAPKPPTGSNGDTQKLALAIAEAGLEKKALGVEILDVTGKVDYADFLVLMTGRSDRHVDAIAQGILADIEQKRKKRALSIEGLPAALWVLIDFGDVVVHVFQEDARSMYDIEGLWLDAERVPVPPGAEEGA